MENLLGCSRAVVLRQWSINSYKLSSGVWSHCVLLKEQNLHSQFCWSLCKSNVSCGGFTSLEQEVMQLLSVFVLVICF